MSKAALRAIHENDLDSCKKWLCDDTSLTVYQGLSHIISPNDSFGPLYQEQRDHLRNKLFEKRRFAGILITRADGFFVIDDIVTIAPNDNDLEMLSQRLTSRPQFVKLMYQYMSHFSDAVYEAYTEVTGDHLRLDDLSEVREFYEECSTFDSWTGHQLCAYISHCDPEALDFLAANPEAQDSFPKTPARHLPERLSRIFSKSDLYEKNAPLVKAAILGGAFELIHLDRDDWEKSSMHPKKGLEWAKKKGIEYHPVLDELLLDVEAAPAIVEPAISSGYTTPYLEMMQEVMREMEISRENQGKKEAIAALFAKKLADHKLTPLSQKLADAMATLVRLPESQQGRAQRKG